MFPKKQTTVDAILATFAKTVQDLEAHASASGIAAAEKSAQARTLEIQADEHRQEAERAVAVAGKLQQLIGN